MNNNFILSRAKERSTWIGLTALLAGLGISVSPELSETIISLGLGISGLIGVISRDK